MKIRKFDSEGHNKWVEFYNELFVEIKRISKGSKISPEDIKKGYNKHFKEKYELIKNSNDFSEELANSKDFKVKNMVLHSRAKKKIIGLEGFGLKIKKQVIIK